MSLDKRLRLVRELTKIQRQLWTVIDLEVESVLTEVGFTFQPQLGLFKKYENFNLLFNHYHKTTSRNLDGTTDNSSFALELAPTFFTLSVYLVHFSFQDRFLVTPQEKNKFENLFVLNQIPSEEAKLFFSDLDLIVHTLNSRYGYL